MMMGVTQGLKGNDNGNFQLSYCDRTCKLVFLFLCTDDIDSAVLAAFIVCTIAGIFIVVMIIIVVTVIGCRRYKKSKGTACITVFVNNFDIMWHYFRF
jgi:hypothetical protein